MGKSVAVLAVHGMGSQGATEPKDTSKLTFSKDLKRLVADEIYRRNKFKFQNHVAWREVFWADILQKRQDNYFHKIKNRTRGNRLRRFLVKNISDAAAYRQIPSDPKANTYKKIHQKIDMVLNHFVNIDEVDDDARLIILAHSLGGHIMSNYLYDLQRNPSKPTDFLNARTTMAFVTFGCNIPLFTFAYDPDYVKPITRPGIALRSQYILKTWWRNYYDKDDVLGYPLSGISKGYRALKKSGELKDIPINAGGPFTFWNLLSHNAYWKDADFYKPVADLIVKAI